MFTSVTGFDGGERGRRWWSGGPPQRSPSFGEVRRRSLDADQSPESLCLDIDTLRTCLGDWRSDFGRAGEWVRPLALALLSAHAGSGGIVVIPQLFMDPTEVAPFPERSP